jgi:glycosyltransferase involved in cell wall biosynthesis
MPDRHRSERSPRLLFVVSEDWYFHSHRLALAEAARAEGFDVAVATRVTSHGDAIRQAGIRVIPIRMRRRSMNVMDELRSILELRRIVAAQRPDIIHNVALKPVLHGSIAARLTGQVGVVNAIAGMGYLFTSSAPRALLVRPVVTLALRALLDGKANRVIVQNPEDLAFLVEHRMVRRGHVRLIRGSGVDTTKFMRTGESTGTPVVMLASRMLRDKGIPDFVAAARLLLDEGVTARFVLVGGPDPGNPASIPEDELRKLVKRSGIEWWGPRSDMPTVIGEAHVVCLPTTYGEGVPKVLLEAAACGRPIVATDVQGCREVVQSEVNGLLVPPREPVALAHAIRRLLSEPETRSRMGEAGRELVQREFSVEHVTAATLTIYRDLLESTRS